jgi:hypothetical protein
VILLSRGWNSTWRVKREPSPAALSPSLPPLPVPPSVLACLCGPREGDCVCRCRYIRVRDVRTVTFIKRLEAMKKDVRVKIPQVIHATTDVMRGLHCRYSVCFLDAQSYPLFPLQLTALIHCFHGNFPAASAA